FVVLGTGNVGDYATCSLGDASRCQENKPEWIVHAMGLLYLAVLGPPEVFHDGSHLAFSLRKAQALLVYLAVEGGMHPRSKLAALLWPDSDPSDARNALRNVIALLRSLLAGTDSSAEQHSH